ncbi:hypothetical protein [Kurthia sibirica]|uniref:Tetratricopeptide repeat protein n=1 Tax=Kurthia sibirica TaxID=202750 RepID=A0A2U3AML4_9BACL|nr:hypothetical protein [Kurthia sibirica]PWI25767.1 hypothetical protein DEX24_06080 [Kurthia sibirica]GEK35462.1 hypothetical protein KSI01_29950 [Kurthia sibirica]
MDSKASGFQVTSLIEKPHTVPTAQQYIQLAQSINTKKYFKLLKEGTKIHPTSLKIQARIIRHYLKNNQPKTALKHLLTSRHRSRQNNTYLFYQHCATLLAKNGRIADALQLVAKGLLKNDAQQQYIEFASKFALRHTAWSLAETAFKRLQKLQPTTESAYNLAVCYQMIGKTDESKSLIQYCIDTDPEGYEELFEDQYRKYTIYTNEQSTIELYKYINPSTTVVATFDTIDKTIDRIPFAYNLIKKKKMDIIALRRHSIHNFHQDLSRETYVEATQLLLKAYSTKFAYGTSLGGYSALYFGTTIPEAIVLAMAPRNSAIADYGSENVDQIVPHQHITPHPKNTNARVSILFDPKNTIDNRYVNNEVLASYPHAQVIHLPYAGHRLPKYLAQTKQLKPLVDRFLAAEPLPTIHFGEKRYLSNEYFWVMAEKCLDHHHFTWALQFANHAIELAPTFDRPHASKIQALMALKKMKEAVAACHLAIVEFPMQARFTILLAECYVLENNQVKAVSIIEQQLQHNHSKKLASYLQQLTL